MNSQWRLFQAVPWLSSWCHGPASGSSTPHRVWHSAPTHTTPQTWFDVNFTGLSKFGDSLRFVQLVLCCIHILRVGRRHLHRLTSRRKRGLSGIKVSPTKEAIAGRAATRTNTRQLWNWNSVPMLKPQPGNTKTHSFLQRWHESWQYHTILKKQSDRALARSSLFYSKLRLFGLKRVQKMYFCES